MMQRSPAPLSPAFEAVAHSAQFRDLIAIVVQTSPDVLVRSSRTHGPIIEASVGDFTSAAA